MSTLADAVRGWMTEADCQARPDLPWTGNPTPGQAQAMAEICAACPVRPSCLGFADAEDIDGGFWAGQDRDPEITRGPSWELVEWQPVQSRAGRDLGEQGALPLDAFGTLGGAA